MEFYGAAETVSEKGRGLDSHLEDGRRKSFILRNSHKYLLVRVAGQARLYAHAVVPWFFDDAHSVSHDAFV